MSMTGKTCLITGANSGLGLAAAKQFAKLGTSLVLVCRDRAKGEAAVEMILQETPDAPLELMICDLASLDSTVNFIHQFRQTHSKLDILFNNAAVMKQKREITADGLETMFQINYFAPVLLTFSLLDLLKNGAPSRIINIAVPPHNMRLDFDHLQPSDSFKGFEAFFLSKLPLLLFSLELSDRLMGSGVTVNITDPGPGKFRSNITREMPRLIAWMVDLFSIPAEKAAETIIYLATSGEVLNETGKLFLGKKQGKLIPYWEDSEARQRLWSVTQKMIDDFRITISGMDLLKIVG